MGQPYLLLCESDIREGSTTMMTLLAFWSAHQPYSALTAYFLFANFVSSLPSPNNASSGFYKWFFAFSSGLGAALPRLLPKLRLPVDPTAGSPTYFAKPVEEVAPKS